MAAAYKEIPHGTPLIFTINTCHSKIKVQILEMPATLKSDPIDPWTAHRNLSTLVAVFYRPKQKLNVSEKQLGCQI